MRKYGIIALLLVVAGGVAIYYFSGDRSTSAAAQAQAEARQNRPQGGGGGGGFGGGVARGPRPPMTVELAPVVRKDMIATVMVVGNLIGAATVDAVPRGQGRLEAVYVRLGDSVRRGQALAKIEDREIIEQIKQADATYNVSQATIRQRRADLKLAQNNLERSRSLYERDLLPRQTFDDTDARFQAAQAQLDLSEAQMAQARSRLDELKINLANTLITAPVEGFIGKRTLDPGASVGVNTSFISVVDIRTVRLVINVIEKDLRRITQGTAVEVEVDAYPGENFKGRVARVAPILDPATRTAQVEIEIPNQTYRLKPGMYARARFTVERHDRTLVVPAASVVELQGKLGVWMPGEGDAATFVPVTIGIEEQELTEVTSGLKEGQRVISTGAAALRMGDKIALVGQRGGSSGRRGGSAGAPGQTPAVNANRGQQPGR
ncbi:MAG TPA: efflux RND transporter periplasmic adaptor subunit [Vicinamibacterales bacterium]|nr:efflux RND transporter periplasmic adaptor subunit [Vicinamibacterales bacterium]